MKKLILIALTILAALPLLAQNTGETKADGEKIVAIINGEKLTVEKFDALWDALGPEMQKNYEMSGGGKLGFLDNYIERRLIVQQAIKENFDKKKSVAYQLESSRDATLFNLYVSDVIAANVIPEAELKKYYDEHSREFRQREARKARHIVATPGPGTVVNTAEDDATTPEDALKKMEGIRKQLTGDPAQFADLATKLSEDVAARSGGDLGWIDRGTMDPAFDAALFELEPGQVSDVIKTEFGYHVILCEQARPAGFKSFEEVKGEIAKKLASEKQADIIAALRAMTRDLREISSVTVNRENL